MPTSFAKHPSNAHDANTDNPNATAPFLSQSWFAMLEALNHEAGDLPLSPTFAALKLNFFADDNTDGAKQTHTLHLADGKLHPGETQTQNSVTLPLDLLINLAKNRDLGAAITAFLDGNLTVTGDIGTLLALKSAVSGEQKRLYKAILAQTAFE